MSATELAAGSQIPAIRVSGDQSVARAWNLCFSDNPSLAINQADTFWLSPLHHLSAPLLP
ncbi:MAG: hypothetical protein ACRBM6_12510 [Geminicoccales bacterium]